MLYGAGVGLFFLKMVRKDNKIDSFVNQDRDQYYAALRTADATGDLTDWLVYFLGGFAYQMVQIKERARAGESEGRS